MWDCVVVRGNQWPVVNSEEKEQKIDMAEVQKEQPFYPPCQDSA